ncbi:cytochrome P450 [Cubamyces sp. BRFM 1775]|nr:cytochrome P450 [Cubamyces sp. BRFM 1775]
MLEVERLAELLNHPLAFLFAIGCGLFIHRILSQARRPLPPGPPGLPLVGNAFDIPTEHSWVTYRDWAARYGDVLAVRAFGQTLVVLNSYTAALDLLEKRSLVYSDRPASVLAELTGWTRTFGFKSYGDAWREDRRLLWKYVQPSATQQFRDAQQREARSFLHRLLADQRDLDGAVKLLACKTVLTAAYGIPDEEIGTQYVDILREADEGLSEAFSPGAFLVEFIPWLQYVPSWVPGTGWKKQLGPWRAQCSTLFDTPFAAAQDAMMRGKAKPSMMSDLLETLQVEGGDSSKVEKTAKDMAGTAFLAATDTTSGTLFAFFCAMVLHPEVQQRAQAELDAVVGRDRLPEHTDRPSLPYVSALVKEVLRWFSPAPLSIPHRCTKEDQYRGWAIPKGATVLINIWAILHDTELFPDPDVFRPERYLKEGQLDDEMCERTSVAFGMGRRVCPGRYFAEDMLFINIASILHIFSILPALDASGRPILPEVKLTSGLVSYVYHSINACVCSHNASHLRRTTSV